MYGGDFLTYAAPNPTVFIELMEKNSEWELLNTSVQAGKYSLEIEGFGKFEIPRVNVCHIEIAERQR